MLGVGERGPGEDDGRSEGLLGRAGPAVPGGGVSARVFAFFCIGGAACSGGLFLDRLGVKA